MAKKKKVKKKAEPGGLTDVQADKLAKALHGTQKNVYRECEKILGFEATEQTFDDLRVLGKIFLCEQCHTWCNTSEESVISDFCTECE